MKKDEILKMSREENEGRYDEREMAAFGAAARIGMLVGGFLCAILVVLSEFVFNKHEIGLAAWLVYFSMQGSNYIALFVKLKAKRQLIYGMIDLAAAVVFAITLGIVVLR